MSDAATQDPVPAPASQQRDDGGRLVAVTWHGAGWVAGTAPGRWLVAVDGSACSLRAVAMAARLAGPARAIDLLYVHPWVAQEAAETGMASRGWAMAAAARRALDQASLHWRLHVVMGQPAPEIVRMAQALGSPGVAIGSHGLTAAESLMLGSVTYQVVHLSKAAVLIVR